jgi:hypothetical protein
MRAVCTGPLHLGELSFKYPSRGDGSKSGEERENSSGSLAYFAMPLLEVTAIVGSIVVVVPAHY